ncbi:putative zinc metalloprotease egy1, chloroplastic [Cymbomonas tetramitiformis]|uniref:Zinc metalloprotease egy1, chloroplastic n=1 Tax=Cymbomonas tetramitiformis TaxID=36881 RepID=A0AAE0ERW0_9CHLO|nr:putative zinc metalloprotease egy1, chloroplastic [Cymbomonas tetramitiformis]
MSELRNVIHIYRNCMRLADYIAMKQGGKEALRSQVRTSFKKNMQETNPELIEEHINSAIRGLSNYYVHESQVLARKDRGEPSPEQS